VDRHKRNLINKIRKRTILLHNLQWSIPSRRSKTTYLTTLLSTSRLRN